MLVVKCRSGSSVTIGPDIRVTVGAVAGEDVCLAVDCPPEISTNTRPYAKLSRALAAGGHDWDPDRMHAVSTGSRPELLIGPAVRLAVLDVTGQSVVLGIAAPPSLPIGREGSRRPRQPVCN